MCPIYLSLRDASGDTVKGRWPLIESQLLSPGDHTIRHGAFSIPLRIEPDDSVRLFLNRSRGSREGVLLYCIQDVSGLRELKGSVHEMLIKPRKGEEVISIVDSEADTILLVERRTNQELSRPSLEREV